MSYYKTQLILTLRNIWLDPIKLIEVPIDIKVMKYIIGINTKRTNIKLLGWYKTQEVPINTKLWNILLGRPN